VEAEGEHDEKGLDRFCFLAGLRSRRTQLFVDAAKGDISGRLDQRRGLWGQPHESRRCGLRAEMLAWRLFVRGGKFLTASGFRDAGGQVRFCEEDGSRGEDRPRFVME
jgi:hypothetical protein